MLLAEFYSKNIVKRLENTTLGINIFILNNALTQEQLLRKFLVNYS